MGHGRSGEVAPERFCFRLDCSVDLRTEKESVQSRLTMPSTVHLGELPVEILERIFLELHYFDIRSMKLVSGDVETPVFAVADDSD